MQDVLGLILGGGRGSPLYPLTKHRSKAAVPIAGKYRLIDIAVSNCLNSGLQRVYVLTQFLSVSLHRHIANTYKFDPFSRGFVEVLPAQVTNEGAGWYQGSADSVRQNLRYLQDDGARDILVLADDLLYRCDFRQLLDFHRRNRADATIVVVPLSRERAPGFGIAQADESGRLTAFVEKPPKPEQLDRLGSPPGRPGPWAVTGPGREFLANFGVYLFRREVLFDLLARRPTGDDFSRDLFPQWVQAYRFMTYPFAGYWEHLDSIKAYHEASLALAGDAPPFDFHSPDGVIYTRMRNLPASRVTSAHLEHCLVSDGCVVGAGARLERCLLGVRSRVGRNVIVRDSVLLGANEYEAAAPGELPAVGIGDDAVLERVIVDKNCRIGRGVRIVNRRALQEDDGENYAIRDGIVVIPNGAVVPDGTVI